MNSYTPVWVAILVAFLATETAAYLSGNYWNMATGHLLRLMLLHPFIAVVVLALSFALTAHLLIDYAILRIRP
jgi:uncharacterized membrane protein